jgi:hypothetical protein
VGWGEGRRIRCRGRGSASSGFATVGGVAGADVVRGRAGVAIARGWRQARGRGRGGRMLAAGADGCVYVSTGWVCGHLGQRVRWSLLLGHYQSLSCV